MQFCNFSAVRSTLLAACVTAVGLTPSIASAALMSADWQNAGDAHITIDDAGLEWLDLDLTQGLTYNQVSSQFGAGGDYEGFRYATQSEVDGLWRSAGWNGMVGDSAIFGSLWSLSNNGVFDVLASFWGETHCGVQFFGCSSPGDGAARAMYDDGAGGALVARMDDSFNVGLSITEDFFVLSNNTINPQTGGPTLYLTGSALVRATPAPEPGVAGLLLTGGILLAVSRRRQSKRT